VCLWMLATNLPLLMLCGSCFFMLQQDYMPSQASCKANQYMLHTVGHLGHETGVRARLLIHLGCLSASRVNANWHQP